jgi:hypothetical protein
MDTHIDVSNIDVSSTAKIYIPTTKPNHKKRNIIIGSIVGLILTIVVIIVSVEVTKEHNKTRTITFTQKPRTVSISKTSNLSTTDLVNNWDTSPEWYILKTAYGQDLCKIKNNYSMEVLYPAGSYNPSGSILGGFSFYSQPGPFPATTITFKYSVMFPIGFNWVKGGKLPGVWIGDTGANGGHHLTQGATFRVMWRENGNAEAYVYTPVKQNAGYYAVPGYVYNDQFGDSLWRGQFQFKTGVWNNITLSTVLNDKSQSNGIISLTINNTTMTYNSIVWRLGNENINGLIMQSFFGGSDKTWSTPTNQYIDFGGFYVSQ